MKLKGYIVLIYEKKFMITKFIEWISKLSRRTQGKPYCNNDYVFTHTGIMYTNKSIYESTPPKVGIYTFNKYKKKKSTYMELYKLPKCDKSEIQQAFDNCIDERINQKYSYTQLILHNLIAIFKWIFTGKKLTSSIWSKRTVCSEEVILYGLKLNNQYYNIFSKLELNNTSPYDLYYFINTYPNMFKLKYIKLQNEKELQPFIHGD